MNRVLFRSGSGAEIGTAHHGFCFLPSNEWVGVDFGWQPRGMSTKGDAQELSESSLLDYVLPERISEIMRHHFITHSHLDHTGALPLLYKMYCAKHGRGPDFTLYMSEIALATAERLLWQPAIRMAKLNERPLPFSEADIEGIKSRVRIVRPGEVLDFEHFRAVAFNAGHVPGALYWIFIPKNGADPVFTSGDASFRDLGIVRPADPIPDEFSRFSIVVMESTYLGRIISDRKVEMARLRAHAEQVLQRRGTLIVPVFAIGSRGPEIGADFEAHNIGPVYYDGTLKDAIRLYKQLGVISSGFDEKSFVRGRGHTQALIESREPKVIIAPGGMMPDGSRSWLYGCDSIGRPEDSVAIVGFQGADTPGAHLLQSAKRGMVQFGRVKGEPVWLRRECDVEQFQLSAHADNPEIEALINRLNPDTVVFNHGEPENIDAYIAANSERFPWRMVRATAGVEVGV